MFSVIIRSDSARCFQWVSSLGSRNWKHNLIWCFLQVHHFYFLLWLLSIHTRKSQSRDFSQVLYRYNAFLFFNQTGSVSQSETRQPKGKLYPRRRMTMEWPQNSRLKLVAFNCDLDLESALLSYIISQRQTFDPSFMKIFQRVQAIWSKQERDEWPSIVTLTLSLQL